MTSACATEKVVICAWMVQNMMVVAQMGSIRTTCFTSSTSVRVHSAHLLAAESPPVPSMMAAWSRNLRHPIRFTISHLCVLYSQLLYYVESTSFSTPN